MDYPLFNKVSPSYTKQCRPVIGSAVAKCHTYPIRLDLELFWKFFFRGAILTEMARKGYVLLKRTGRMGAGNRKAEPGISRAGEADNWQG